MSDNHWKQPDQWHAEARRKGGIRGLDYPHLVFCQSMGDAFEDHPTTNHEREKLWPIIRRTPNLDWQLLTKRPQNFERFLPDDWGQGWPNVWLGVTVENGKTVNTKRAEILRDTPAAFRFISYEPAIGPIGNLNLQGIGLLIFGGESGPQHRPCDLQWAVDARAQCARFGTTFFFKQSGGHQTETGIKLNGELIRTMPGPRRNPKTGETGDLFAETGA